MDRLTFLRLRQFSQEFIRKWEVIGQHTKSRILMLSLIRLAKHFMSWTVILRSQVKSLLLRSSVNRFSSISMQYETYQQLL